MSSDAPGPVGRDLRQALAIPPALFRLVVFGVTIMLISQWPIISLLLFWGMVVWLAPRVYRDRGELVWLRRFHQESRARISELEADAARAQHQILFLEQQIEGGGCGSPQKEKLVFRRVGLDADCPRWVAEAVRREYRRRLHPDTKPLGQKAEAHRQFIAAEAAFDEIWTIRGFKD